jgi:Fe-S cluster assembly iron-binding protein IscA
VSNAEPEDILIEPAGVKVLVDSLSLSYLAGSEIDYIDDLMTASFKIKNRTQPLPAAAARASRFEAVPSRAHSHQRQ